MYIYPLKIKNIVLYFIVLAMFQDATTGIFQVMPASKLNDSPALQISLLERLCQKTIYTVRQILNTYHTLLQSGGSPCKLPGILRPLSIICFFQFAEVVPNVSYRGVFGEQTVHHQFVGLFFCTLDIMFLWFTLASLADFPVKKKKHLVQFSRLANIPL